MNPSTGQFLSKDSYEGDTSNPITQHKYLYAHANPVTYEDPSGYFAISKTVVVMAAIALILTASTAPNMPALKMSGTITMDWGQSLQLQYELINIFEGMTELGSMFSQAIRAARGDSEAVEEASEAGASETGNKELDDILDDAQPGRKTKGKTEQWEKEGGYDKALQDFDDLGVENVEDMKTGYGTGKKGKLKDGRDVNVRPGSSAESPTLEVINPNGTRIKIRYR